jgi:phosphomannomutase
LKGDEAAIRASVITINEAQFNAHGMLHHAPTLPSVHEAATAHYLRRYQHFFPADCLRGRRIGVYQHSTVLRDTYVAVLETLGATVITLGRSEHFIPVDTEAIRPEDVELAAAWATEYGFDAIVSADGDGDRPLISDERGQWLRGDVAGILCAQYMQADSVITPVSSNSALELSSYFDDVRRTRIGSPYVIAAMQEAVAEGHGTVVGYEANGGFLTATTINHEGRTLTALPTRDAIIVPLAVLMAAGDMPISQLVRQLPPRFTSSGRLKNVPVSCSQSHLADLLEGEMDAMNAWLTPELNPAHHFDTTDGLRITLDNGEIVHIRPSGNAPELRCYNEADSQQRAEQLNHLCLKKLAAWIV